MKIAVQLYSVRDHIKNGEDMLKVLEQVKALGYDGVEFAGYFGLDAEVLRAKLDELGLVCVGGHIGLDDFLPVKIEKTYEYQKTLGALNIGVGGAPHRTMVECKLTGKILGKANKELEPKGMKVYYHNHSDEFKPLRNKMLPIDVLKECCWLQVDTYWSFHAGVDNYKFITENKDKIVFLHVKDGIDGKPKALGEGNCDIPAVVKAAKDCGIEWLIVENDDPVPNGLDDIGRSIKYLKTLL